MDVCKKQQKFETLSNIKRDLRFSTTKKRTKLKIRLDVRPGVKSDIGSGNRLDIESDIGSDDKLDVGSDVESDIESDDRVDVGLDVGSEVGSDLASACRRD